MEDARRNTGSPPFLLVVLMSVTLAGCLGAGRPLSTEVEGDDNDGPRRWINVTTEDLVTRPGNLVVTVQAVRNTSYELSLDNEAPLGAFGHQGGTWSSCASAQWGKADQRPAAYNLTQAWTYTQGHALQVESRHGSAQVDSGDAVDNYYGLLRHHISRNGTLKAGDWLRFSVAADDGQGPSFAPWINLSAPEPALEIIDRTAYGFACAANTQPFDPLVVHNGLPPAPTTVARNAVANVTTTTATEAYLYAAPSPRPPLDRAGFCETSITLDDETVNATDRRRACYLAATGPPGRVGLRLDELVGYSTRVSFFVYDRPA